MLVDDKLGPGLVDVLGLDWYGRDVPCHVGLPAHVRHLPTNKIWVVILCLLLIGQSFTLTKPNLTINNLSKCYCENTKKPATPQQQTDQVL